MTFETMNTFKIIIPNMNRMVTKERETVVTPQMQKILDYIEENEQITEPEIQGLLEPRKARSFTLAKLMRDEGLISVEGRGDRKRYLKI